MNKTQKLIPTTAPQVLLDGSTVHPGEEFTAGEHECPDHVLGLGLVKKVTSEVKEPSRKKTTSKAKGA